MSDRLVLPERPRSSRRRYRAFVEEYKPGRLDDSTEGGEDHQRLDDSADTGDDLAPEVVRSKRRGKRRDYLRDYLRWLQPHRYAVGVLLVIALLGAGRRGHDNWLVADGQPKRGAAGHSRKSAEPELDFPGRRIEVPTGGAEQAPSPLPEGSWRLVGQSGVKGRDRFASDFCAAGLLGAQG